MTMMLQAAIARKRVMRFNLRRLLKVKNKIKENTTTSMNPDLDAEIMSAPMATEVSAESAAVLRYENEEDDFLKM